MAFHVRDRETDAAVRRLAALTGKSLTTTIRDAVERAFAFERRRQPLIERLAPLQAEFAALVGPAGKPADKAFFDELSGDL